MSKCVVRLNPKKIVQKLIIITKMCCFLLSMIYSRSELSISHCSSVVDSYTHSHAHALVSRFAWILTNFSQKIFNKNSFNITERNITLFIKKMSYKIRFCFEKQICRKQFFLFVKLFSLSHRVKHFLDACSSIQFYDCVNIASWKHWK